MITHLFKLIWNKKKQNFLIMLELFLSFLTMFAVFSIITNYYHFYSAPTGFEYNNVWSIKRTSGPSEKDAVVSKDTLWLREMLIKQQLKAMPQIEEVSYSSQNTPYANTRMAVGIKHEKVNVISDIYTTDDSYASLLNAKLESGRWFTKDDDASNYTPAVINHKLKQKLFGDKNPVNQLVKLGGTNYKVIGVVNTLKSKGDYVKTDYAFYVRGDSSFYASNPNILIRVKPGTDANFEAHLFKTLSGLMKNTSIKIDQLDNLRQSKNDSETLPLIFMIIIVLFFIINVALGLFGVLWYNINKRKGEIGLRRAIGASGNGISKQLVGEVMVLATISLIAGCFFAIQFPLMNIFDLEAKTYVIAIIMAIAFIYLLAVICSFYPGKQAAAIYPAVALHEE